MTSTLKCQGKKAKEYALSTEEDDDFRLSKPSTYFEVWGGLLYFELEGKPMNMLDQFRLYIHAATTVMTMPRVSEAELASEKWPCTCVKCLLHCKLPGCAIKDTHNWDLKSVERLVAMRSEEHT